MVSYSNLRLLSVYVVLLKQSKGGGVITSCDCLDSLSCCTDISIKLKLVYCLRLV